MNGKLHGFCAIQHATRGDWDGGREREKTRPFFLVFWVKNEERDTTGVGAVKTRTFRSEYVMSNDVSQPSLSTPRATHISLQENVFLKPYLLFVLERPRATDFRVRFHPKSGPKIDWSCVYIGKNVFTTFTRLFAHFQPVQCSAFDSGCVKRKNRLGSCVRFAAATFSLHPSKLLLHSPWMALKPVVGPHLPVTQFRLQKKLLPAYDSCLSRSQTEALT